MAGLVQEIDNLRRFGDELQSSASRLAEWVLERVPDVPYEVHMAAIEAETAVKGWTETRRRSSV